VKRFILRPLALFSPPTLTLLLTLLAACGPEAPISIQVFPVVLAADTGPEAAQWEKIEFAGGTRAPAGTYYVMPDTLMTEWNILTFKAAGQQEEDLAVAVRLNAYASRRFASFAADPANAKQPLALRINGRWADISPLLAPPGDRLLLYNFTRADVDKLQAYIEQK
jgi:hypothetical protein